MEWKAVPGFPDYVANRNGQIKSLLRGGRILKSNVASTGYPMVNMKMRAVNGPVGLFMLLSRQPSLALGQTAWTVVITTATN